MIDEAVRIACWSGPRNLSTAFMRSFEARGDTAVWDEPLYAHYLKTTGLPHPMADVVLARHETDWRRVVEGILGPVPDGKRIFFQKHMAHHLTPDVSREWLDEVRHVFLLRDPREVLTSLADKLHDIRLADTGLPQQLEIFDHVRARSGTPPVVDARDLLLDPPGVLERLCQALGIPWTERMLSWEPGIRPTDGVWAEHWYDAVARSTGFEPYRRRHDPVPAELEGVLARCEELHARLYHHRLR